MQTKHELYQIKNALKKEISEINVNDAYSVKGSFKVVPFLSATAKRKGKFETKLDENLKIVTLKITEDQQQ